MNETILGGIMVGIPLACFILFACVCEQARIVAFILVPVGLVLSFIWGFVFLFGA
jgi:hypothetical protein